MGAWTTRRVHMRRVSAAAAALSLSPPLSLTRRALSSHSQAGLGFLMVPGKIMCLHYQHNRVK